MNIFILLIAYLAFSQVNLILPNEKREELLGKYAKEIFDGDLTDFYFEPFQGSIPYNKTKIDDLIKKYNFPSEYNFIESKKPKVHIKEQKNCGCCWAMASTTALSYRYFVKGVEVDLSPQHELSCYVRNCKHGNNLIDPQLSLIKNGTLTEECLPFSSGEQIIEECPTTCKNPEIEYKKYYAKNAYFIGINENNFYEVTSIIIDQLLTDGPVVTNFNVYSDFVIMSYYADCPNKVYTYDGESPLIGRHDITIVGYGVLDNKYYWLCQNSWGETSCQNGFIKIEFGQVGIGNIAFSQPYIQEQISNSINVQFGSLNQFCFLEIKSTSNLDRWKAQLNVIFKHNGKSAEFDYICGVNKIFKDTKKIFCNYEFLNKETAYKGEYVYDSYRVIGKENIFNLDNSFRNKKFIYYGYDSFQPLSKIFDDKEINNSYYFVSDKGSRFSFIYEPAGIDQSMSPIFTSLGYRLNNCQKTPITLDTEKTKFIAYCELQGNEINVFDEYPPKYYQMINYALCSYKNYMNFYTFKLDKSKYPILNVTDLVIDNTQNNLINYFLLVVDIEGSVSGCTQDTNDILFYIQVEENKVNSTEQAFCSFKSPDIIQKNFKILCYFIYNEFNASFTNVYLLPYYTILKFYYPIEVKIQNVIKGIFYIPQDDN